MTIDQLRKLLEAHPGDSRVMILDGFNGGGTPRKINIGPTTHLVTDEDAADACDCEDIVGATVVVLGYGCY